MIGSHRKAVERAKRTAVEGREAEVVDADAGESGFLALRVFVRTEEESFVFLDWAAEGHAGLHAGERLLDWLEHAGCWIDLAGEGIASLK